MASISEKDIKINFINNSLNTFKNLLKVPNLRLYSMEFPVRTKDGIKYADIILEIIYEGRKNIDNPLIVIEFKRDKIDLGVVEQVLRYSKFIQLQLYRTKRVTRFIAGPSFSKFELDMAKDNEVHCLQFDLKGNLQIV